MLTADTTVIANILETRDSTTLFAVHCLRKVCVDRHDLWNAIDSTVLILIMSYTVSTDTGTVSTNLE